MARLRVQDLSEFTQNLAKLGGITETERVCKSALFDGAAVVADTMRAEIEALPVGNEHGSPEHPINTVTKVQKSGLLDGLGIATMKRNDFGWDTSVGFDGYNNVLTENFPSGQPNAMIAAAVEGGTSFRARNAFITRALRKCRAKAQAAMKTTSENEMKSIMEE